MKFYNVAPFGYAYQMSPVAPCTMMARLRTSVRLTVLVLLIFTLKIGAAAACAKHDFSDLGFGGDSQHGAVLKVSGAGEPDSLPKGSLTHAGGCSHCSCHHAVAIVPQTRIVFALVPQGGGGAISRGILSATSRLELRPPIV